jgi:hypothetical protein
VEAPLGKHRGLPAEGKWSVAVGFCQEAVPHQGSMARRPDHTINCVGTMQEALRQTWLHTVIPWESLSLSLPVIRPACLVNPSRTLPSKVWCGSLLQHVHARCRPSSVYGRQGWRVGAPRLCIDTDTFLRPLPRFEGHKQSTRGFGLLSRTGEVIESTPSRTDHSTLCAILRENGSKE